MKSEVVTAFFELIDEQTVSIADVKTDEVDGIETCDFVSDGRFPLEEVRFEYV